MNHLPEKEIIGELKGILMNHLSGKEIVDELRGRIRNLRVSIMSEVTSKEFKEILKTREVALQSVLSWILGQTQSTENGRTST